MKFLMAIFLILIMIIGLPALVINIKTVRAESNFNDNFNDGVADDWTQQVGSWSVINGEYSVSVGIVENGISTVDELNLKDCTIETKFRFTDDVGFRAGIVFRYMKKDTYYSLEVSNEYDVLCFVKYLPECAGYGTQDHGFIGTAPTEINFAHGELMLGRKVIGSVPVARIDKGVEYTLRVTISGNTFVGELTSDGFYQRIVWEDTDNPFNYGTAGLRARRADVSFDYFKISNPIPIPKPTLDISCKSSTFHSGFVVEIEGNLAFNGTAIPYTPILLSYSVTGGKSWEDLTLVNTFSDGSYSVTWIPSVTGNYLIKATYEGNETYRDINTVVNFALARSAEKTVFSVTSNSTISSLIFNSQTYELSFTVIGPEGTTGYVDMYIPNSLIANITTVKAYIDGNEIDYTFTSVNDSWLLHFIYKHSTHEVILSLGPLPSIAEPEIEPEPETVPQLDGIIEEGSTLPFSLSMEMLLMVVGIVVAIVGVVSYKLGENGGSHEIHKPSTNIQKT